MQKTKAHVEVTFSAPSTSDLFTVMPLLEGLATGIMNETPIQIGELDGRSYLTLDPQAAAKAFKVLTDAGFGCVNQENVLKVVERYLH